MSVENPLRDPFVVDVPLRLESLPNVGGSGRTWQGRTTIRKRHRRAVDAAFMVRSWRFREWLDRHGSPFRVLLVRIAGRELDDDNLAASFKFIRDAVAERLGVDDGDIARVAWLYAEERSEMKRNPMTGRKRAAYAVRIEIEGVPK